VLAYGVGGIRCVPLIMARLGKVRTCTLIAKGRNEGLSMDRPPRGRCR
jgi:hypothetical protein